MTTRCAARRLLLSAGGRVPTVSIPGVTMTDPKPDFTSPIAGRVEVREPCPWCPDRPMISRTLMDAHVAEAHPEVQTVEAASAPVPTELRDRVAEALAEARRPGLGGMTEARTARTWRTL